MTHDYELYRRFISSGDERAFEELIALYMDPLAGYINGIVREDTTAKELVIDTFAALALNREPFKEMSSFRTYLFSIGKRLAFRYIKQNGKQAAISEALLSDKLCEEAGQPSPEDEHLHEQQKKVVHTALASLKLDHRDVLRLLFFEGMTYAEAGAAMKKTEGQIRGLTHRAKAALKKRLERERFSE